MNEAIKKLLKGLMKDIEEFQQKFHNLMLDMRERFKVADEEIRESLKKESEQ